MERMNLGQSLESIEKDRGGVSVEQTFMQHLIQFLEVDKLPVRPSTQFGDYLGEHPSVFGEETNWFKANEYRGDIVLEKCEPILRRPDYGFGDATDEIISFEGLRICLGSAGERKAFIVAYNGLLFVFSERTGFNVEFNDSKVTVVNKGKGRDLSFDLKYNEVEEEPAENEQLFSAKFVMNFLDNLSSDDYTIESASVYSKGMGVSLSRFPSAGRWYKPGKTLDSVRVSEPTLLEPGVVDCMKLNLFVGSSEDEYIIMMTYSGVVYKLGSRLGFDARVSDSNRLVIKGNDGFIKYDIES